MLSKKDTWRQELGVQRSRDRCSFIPDRRTGQECAPEPLQQYKSCDVAVGGTACFDDVIQLMIITEQNDLFRRSWPRALIPGRFLLMPGVAARPGPFQITCLSAVRSYDHFSAGTYPHDTHQMSAIEVDGETIWFCIDLYDELYKGPPESPTNPNTTRRLLTVYSANEWKAFLRHRNGPYSR